MTLLIVHSLNNRPVPWILFLKQHFGAPVYYKYTPPALIKILQVPAFNLVPTFFVFSIFPAIFTFLPPRA